MVAIEVDVNSSIGNLKDMPKALLESGLDKTAAELIRNLMINSPVDNGLLKQWAVTDSDDTSRTVQSPAEYAEYVNYGTRPHFIYPTNKKMLYWDGADHPVPFVVHPGTTPTLFVENSIEATKLRIEEFFTINGG